MAETQPSAASDGATPGIAPERFVPIEQIHPNPDQPRKVFNEDALSELAGSIAEKGLIQPIIVRTAPGGDGFQIVAGERRWRAAQRARLHELPVVVREFTDTEVLEIAIIENIQRSDLNPIEEGRAYAQLMDRHGHTQDQLSTALGKSRSHIANTMRLLKLPEPVLDMVQDGQLSAGHARALLTTEDPLSIARQIVKGGLSVREAERLAKKDTTKALKPSTTPSSQKDADTVAIEQELSATLGVKVEIDHREDGRGKLILSYSTAAHLDDICRLLTKSEF